MFLRQIRGWARVGSECVPLKERTNPPAASTGGPNKEELSAGALAFAWQL